MADLVADLDWLDLCCGSGATTLNAIGGPSLEPLTGWMGGKRRFASGILAAMGVRRRRIRSATMVDAGAWGWVWPAILDEELGAEVAEVLEGWREEDPVALWDRLAKEPLPEDPALAVAHWLWIQGRSASNTPVWYEVDEGWQKAQRPDQHTRQKATQRGSWRMGDRGGRAQKAAQNTSIPGNWRMGEKTVNGTRGACQSGTGGGRCNGLRSTETVANRIRSIAEITARWIVLQAGSWQGKEVTADLEGERFRTHGFARPSESSLARNGHCFNLGTLVERTRHLPRSITAIQALVEEVEPPADASSFRVYFDPPYRGRTGYEVKLPRESVLEVARRWDAAGAVVAVSEGEPLLELEGWHHVDLTPLGRKGCGPEHLTLNRPPAWTPGRQVSLF